MKNRLDHRLRLGLAGAGLAMLAACPQLTAVWIPPGSTVRSLTFQLGAERGVPGDIALGAVDVWKCTPSSRPDSGSVWRIRAYGHAQMVQAVRYGTAPAGFTVEIGPLPLQPGCYLAQVGGTGATRFRVAQNGSVTDEGDPW